MNDPYETLGLTPDAGEAEIRRRYLELVRESPPDRAPERFTAIHAAYAALRQAIEQFRAVEPKEAQAAWSAGKVLAEALGDLDESLDRGRREIEKARRRAEEESAEALAEALAGRFRRRSWLRRRLIGGY